MCWTIGYSFPPIPDGPSGWAALREGFEWDVPDAYNIATVALERGKRADETALRHVDREGGRHAFSYGDLRRAADALAGRLAADGFQRGDRIGVCLPQCPEQLLVHAAAYRLGVVVVPLSMLLGDDSLRYSLSHSDATLLVIDRGRYEESNIGTETVDDCVVVETGERYLGEVTRTGSAFERPLGGLSEYVDGHSENAIDPVETSPDDPALLLYTSGTTGNPKGVLAAHRYLLGSLPAYHCYFHLFDPDDARSARVFTPSEWAWAGALFDVVFPTLALGGTVVSRERRTGFDPDRALELVEREEVTHAFLPPTALGRIRTDASLEDRSLESLSVIMCGGEKLSPSLFRWAEDALDVTVNETYGQTEANGLVANCQAVFDVEAGSMGRPVPGHEVAVLDDDGNEAPAGERGQLALHLPDFALFLEYWMDPDATAAKYADEGWFLTGDLVRRDEDGRLWHAGRTDDLIITAGYRVSPLEVERALTTDPAVTDAVVGGVPDTERGERIKAYVVLTADKVSTDDLERRLRARVRTECGAHKVPREFEFVTSLPETRSGKASRSTLFDGA